MEAIETVLGKMAEMGFPAAIAIYLLVRMETKLAELTGAILELKYSISGRDRNV